MNIPQNFPSIRTRSCMADTLRFVFTRRVLAPKWLFAYQPLVFTQRRIQQKINSRTGGAPILLGSYPSFPFLNTFYLLIVVFDIWLWSGGVLFFSWIGHHVPRCEGHVCEYLLGKDITIALLSC
ncbi:hypothetical protein HDV57DRAFT_491441 [Trichoderma longibrachiatum]